MLKITGLKSYERLNYKFSKLIRLHQDTVRNELNKFGKKGVREMKQRMRERKTGRIYRMGGRNHRASSAGEAPAVLTGTLYRGTQYEYIQTNNRYLLHLGYTTPYGKYLEFGTSRIAPRPNISHVYSNRESLISPIMRRLVNQFNS